MPETRAKLTYEDYVEFLPDGHRYEIIDGELYMTPAPSPLHQRASKRLQRRLEAYFEDTGLGEVFDAPIDVIFSRHDVVQPDLVVVTDPAQISGRAIEGAPFLIVEVLSPTTTKTDRAVKLDRYARGGVPHYWIADPDARCLECYRVEKGAYRLVVKSGPDEPFAHPDFSGLEISVADLWGS